MSSIRHPGSLLKESDLSKAQFLHLVHQAAALKMAKRDGTARQLLSGRNIALLAQEAWTRTRSPRGCWPRPASR